MAETEWITTAVAAELTAYDREYIRRLVRVGKIRARKFGTLWQIDRVSLLDYYQASQESEDLRRGPKNE